jgi:ATP-dependent DNA helicase RecQ
MNQELFIVAEKQRKNLLKNLQKLGVMQKHHAGLDNAIRSKTQDEFINDDCKVVLCNYWNGIDKSNVRWVIHYNLQKTLKDIIRKLVVLVAMVCHQKPLF